MQKLRACAGGAVRRPRPELEREGEGREEGGGKRAEGGWIEWREEGREGKERGRWEAEGGTEGPAGPGGTGNCVSPDKPQAVRQA